MASMDDDLDLAEIFASGDHAGLRPKTEVEATYIIPWWQTILPWRKPALAFYSREPEEELEDLPTGSASTTGDDAAPPSGF